MMHRFDKVVQLLGISDEMYLVLKVPLKQVIVGLPVTLDSNEILTFGKVANKNP